MSDLPIEDGIYTDITDEQYFADKSRVNCSSLKKVIMNGGATAFLKEETIISEAMRMGTAFHTLVLEPEKFDERFVVIPDVSFSTKEGKALKELYTDCVMVAEKGRKSDEEKKIVLKEPHYEELRALKEGLLVGADGTETLAAKLLAKEGFCECVVLFTYMGIPCKIKVDKLLNEGKLLDLKTCQSCHNGNFERDVFDRGYFLQSAFYKLAFKVLTGQSVDFIFLAVEKTDSIWLSQCYNTDAWDQKAQALIDFYLPLTYDAMKTKQYSTYTYHDQQRVMPINLDGWIAKKIDGMLHG